MSITNANEYNCNRMKYLVNAWIRVNCEEKVSGETIISRIIHSAVCDKTIWMIIHAKQSHEQNFSESLSFDTQMSMKPAAKMTND